MDLYKAIGEEEFDLWNVTEKLSRGTTFTSNHEEAIAMGMEFISGRIYIASMLYDQDLFENIRRHDYYLLAHEVDLGMIHDRLSISPLSRELLRIISD